MDFYTRNSIYNSFGSERWERFYNYSEYVLQRDAVCQSLDAAVCIETFVPTKKAGLETRTH